MTQIVKKITAGGIALLPMLALAQYDVGSLGDGFTAILDILNRYVIPLIIGIAVVVFLWGLIEYVTAGADEEKRKSARNHIIYGIIAIFVMISVWGLVNVLRGTFGLDTGNIPEPPQIPGTN